MRAHQARWFAFIAVVLAAAMTASADAPARDQPRRVVSMNVCTDQLAMLLAAPGQLHSVSFLAADPTISALAGEAEGFVLNHGLAEEIFLMQPDLILAGAYSTRATTAMLRRLGFRVEVFEPERDFDGVRSNITRMGQLLGREDQARRMVAGIDVGLAELARHAPSQKSVALYYPNSFTAGSGTLVDAVITAAGLHNLADDFGLTGTVRLPLEVLVMANPDLVVGGDRRHQTPALAEQNLVHPAFRAFIANHDQVTLPSRYTVCGAPFTLEAARTLQTAAEP